MRSSEVVVRALCSMELAELYHTSSFARVTVARSAPTIATLLEVSANGAKVALVPKKNSFGGLRFQCSE
eukprot:scaffold180021_cov35-Tisochrysis_lutea.AAC.3